MPVFTKAQKMSFGLLSVLLLAPVELAPEGKQKPKIIVLDLVNGADLDEARLEALGDAVVTALSGAPVEVLSAADLRKTVEVKASQSALGCVQGDCLLDLAKAWQARYVLTGSIAQFKNQIILNLKLIDSNNDNLKVLLRETVEAEPTALTALARVSAAKIRQKLGGPPPSSDELSVLRAKNVPLVGLSFGLAGVGGLLTAGWYQLQANDSGQLALAESSDRILGPFHADRSDAAVGIARWSIGISAALFVSAYWSWSQGL